MNTVNSNTQTTYEQRSQEIIDWMNDFYHILGPLLKLAFMAGMIYMNVQMGIALSMGDWVFPALCGSLDVAMLWFWNRRNCASFTCTQKTFCTAWACYLLFLSLVSGLVYGLSMDAKQQQMTDPTVVEMGAQLEKARSMFMGMKEDSAEKAFGGDPVYALQDSYLKAYGDAAVDLGYPAIHHAFHVIPVVKNYSELAIGIMRLLFIIGVIGTALALSYFGAGIGRAARLGVAPEPTPNSTPADDNENYGQSGNDVDEDFDDVAIVRRVK